MESFLEVLVKEQHACEPVEKMDFVEWERVKGVIDNAWHSNKMHMHVSKNRQSRKKEVVEMIQDNFGEICDMTDCLKERFEYQGLLDMCDMNSLYDILVKHVVLEDIVLSDEDGSFCSDDDDIYF